MPPRPHPLEVQNIMLGQWTYLGTIDATTTSKTNAEATTPFNTTGELLKGKLLMFMCDATTVRVATVSTSTSTVTTNRTGSFGVPIATANSAMYVLMGQRNGYIAAITSASTANVDVWEMS
jgi:hypothetical protein